MVLNPEVAGGVVVAYLVDGRLTMPKDETVFNVGDAEIKSAPRLPSAPTTRAVLTEYPAAVPGDALTVSHP